MQTFDSNVASPPTSKVPETPTLLLNVACPETPRVDSNETPWPTEREPVTPRAPPTVTVDAKAAVSPTSKVPVIPTDDPKNVTELLNTSTAPVEPVTPICTVCALKNSLSGEYVAIIPKNNIKYSPKIIPHSLYFYLCVKYRMRSKKNKQISRRTRRNIPIPKIESLPLKLYYDSPYGTFDNKELTHVYSLGAKLYTSIDEHETPSGRPSGTVMLKLANCPTHNSNRSAITVLAFFSIYNKSQIFGTIQCSAGFQTALNSHGIFQDGEFKFCIINATHDYSFLSPFKGKFAEITITIKHGVSSAVIPDRSVFQTDAPKRILDEVTLKKYMYPTMHFNKFNSTHQPEKNHIQEFSVDSILYPNHESMAKLMIGENCGHFITTSIAIDSIADLTRKDTCFIIIYAITNGDGKTGNITVSHPSANIPLTQKGTWSSVPSNNLRIGYILYADGDFEYLLPNNNVQQLSLITIDKATLDRIAYFPKKSDTYKDPSISEIPNSATVHSKFYTGVPTIIGGELSHIETVSKYTTGAVVPKTNKLISNFSHRKFSVYADIRDTDTNKYIGMAISTNYTSYVNNHPITWCVFSAIFNDGTYLTSNTISNDELQSNGSVKETADQGTYIIYGCSRNYNNAIKITRNSKIDTNTKNGKVIRYYTVWKSTE